MAHVASVYCPYCSKNIGASCHCWAGQESSAHIASTGGCSAKHSLVPCTEVSLCQPAFSRESRVSVSTAEWITTPVPITSLFQSSFRVTFRSMPTGAHLDLHISTCLESVLRKRDLANVCLQERICQSSAQGLVSIWEVQSAAYNPLLRSSLPGIPGRC